MDIFENRRENLRPIRYVRFGGKNCRTGPRHRYCAQPFVTCFAVDQKARNRRSVCEGDWENVWLLGLALDRSSTNVEGLDANMASKEPSP